MAVLLGDWRELSREDGGGGGYGGILWAFPTWGLFLTYRYGLWVEGGYLVGCILPGGDGDSSSQISLS